MADAEHVIAINTDPDAPIFAHAQLGLVADLHDVLAHMETHLRADNQERARDGSN
jgi:electron transfer flavoprotein alpha subunit